MPVGIVSNYNNKSHYKPAFGMVKYDKGGRYAHIIKGSMEKLESIAGERLLEVGYSDAKTGKLLGSRFTVTVEPRPNNFLERLLGYTKRYGFASSEVLNPHRDDQMTDQLVLTAKKADMQVL